MSNIIVSPASGVIEFNTGDPSGSAFYTSTAPIRLDATGGNSWITGSNVGIGTTNPSSQLEVNGGGSDTHLKINSASTSNKAGLKFEGDTNDYRIQYQESNRLEVRTPSANPAMVWDSNGYVGIGTYAPARTLAVEGTIQQQDPSNSARLSRQYNDATAQWFGPVDARPSYLLANNTPWVTIETDGRVGIGKNWYNDTSGPLATLDVRGTISGSGNFLGTGVGNRITLGGTGYLLSGDSPAETQTLQDVTDNGSTTTNAISIATESPSYISGNTNSLSPPELLTIANGGLQIYNKYGGVAPLTGALNSALTIKGMTTQSILTAGNICISKWGGKFGVESGNFGEGGNPQYYIGMYANDNHKWYYYGDLNFYSSADGYGANPDVTFASDGKVGIGTDDPSVELEVIGDTTLSSADGSAYGTLTFGNSTTRYIRGNSAELQLGSAIQQLHFQKTDGAAQIASAAADGTTAIKIGSREQHTTGNIFEVVNGPFHAHDASLLVDYTGNVGIGANSPSNRLEVSGGVSITDGGTSSPVGTEGLHLMFDQGTAASWIKSEKNGTSNRPLQFGASLYNFNYGNVGIGVAVPTSKLTVEGDIYTSSTSYAITQFQLVGGKYWSFRAANSSNDLHFYSAADTVTRMALTSGGNLGIGTTIPLATLDVRGDISGSGNFLGTGVGNRITNNGTPYLLSGDSPAETQTLQDVTTNGNTTTTSILSTGPHISGVSGIFGSLDPTGEFIVNTSNLASLESESIGVYDQGLVVQTRAGSTSPIIKLMRADNGVQLKSPYGNDELNITSITGGKVTTTSNSFKTLYGYLGEGYKFAAATTEVAKIHADGNNGYGEMIFSVTPTGGSMTEAMRIDRDGNVGIGTASPVAPLTVKVNTAGAEDKVFEVVANDGRALSILQPDNSNNDDPWTFTTNNAYEFRVDSIAALAISSDGTVSVGRGLLGTGVGNRITNDGTPYLLSGDSPAETQTLQDVTTNGNTTTTSILSTGPHISGVTGLFSNKVGINATPTHYTLTVGGEAYVSSNMFAPTVYANTIRSQMAGGDLILQNSWSDARVGIGTASPGEMLELGTGGRIGLKDSAGTYDSAIYVDGSTFKVTTGDGSYHADKVNLLDLLNLGAGHSIRGVDSSIIANKDILAPKSGSFGFRTYGATSQYNAITSIYVDNNTNSLGINTKAGGTTSEAMRITSAGDVGIGTTAPNTLLDVRGTISGYTGLFDDKVGIGTNAPAKTLHIVSSSSEVDLRMDNSSAANVLTVNSDGDYEFNTNSNEDVFVIKNQGNVGVGTVNPSDQLEVYGNAEDVALRIHEDAGSHEARLHLRRGGSDWEIINNNQLAIETEGTEVFRITTVGDVGIGTSPPSAYKLHLNDDDTSTLAIQCNGNNATGSKIRLIEGSSNFQGAYMHYDGSVNKFNLGVHDTNNTTLSDDTAAITIDRETAYVGIGSTSPTVELDVVSTGFGASMKWTQDLLHLSNTGDAANQIIVDCLVNSPTGSFLRLVEGQSYGYLGGYMQYEGATNKLNIGTHDTANLDFDDDVAAITIDRTTAKVGIGTTNPSQKLHVSNGQLQVTSGAVILTDSYPITWGAGLASQIYAGGGTSDMVFNVGSSEAMRINGLSRNVGIGTNNPASKLEVAGIIRSTNSTAGEIALFNGSSERASFKDANTHASLGASVAMPLHFRTNNTDWAAIGAGGLFSIGTTTPQTNTALTIQGKNTAPSWSALKVQDSATGNLFTVLNDGSVGVGTTTPLALLDVRGDISGSGSFLGTGIGNRITNNGTPYLLSGDSPAETQTLQDVTTNGNTTTTSILSTGPHISGVSGLFSDNVGIGTASPASKLHVRSPDSNVLRLSSDEALYDDSQEIGIDFYGRWYSGQPSVLKARASIVALGDINGYSRGQLSFRVANDAVPSEVVRIDRHGNVGIGTNSPASKLDVDGNVTIGGGAYYAGYSAAPSNGLLVEGKVGIGTYSVGAQEFSVYGSGVIGRSYVNYVAPPTDGLTVEGKVGIGTYGTVTNQCEVYGNLSVGQSYAGNAAPTNGISVEGSVGIGTRTPTTTLDVRGTISGLSGLFGGTIKTEVYAIGSLPSASPAGQRAFVNDSYYAYNYSVIGNTAYAGGSYPAPVYSDGTYWKYG